MLHLEPTLVTAATIATVGAVITTTRAPVGIVVVTAFGVDSLDERPGGGSVHVAAGDRSSGDSRRGCNSVA